MDGAGNSEDFSVGLQKLELLLLESIAHLIRRPFDAFKFGHGNHPLRQFDRSGMNA